MKSASSLLSHHCSKNRLSCYLDGELSDRQAARVGEHLIECRICRDELESLRATIALLRAHPAPGMPRSIVIPESAVAAQCQTRRVDTTFAALRLGAVAVTLMLAVLLSQEAIQAVRPAQLHTVAVELATESGPALEGAGGGPGVLREAPVERKAAPEAEPVSTVAVEQVAALAADKSAESSTEMAEEDAAAPEALSLMAAPVAEETAPGDALDSEVPESLGEVTDEVSAAALQSPVEAQAEMAGSDAPAYPPQADALAELSAASEPASAKIALAERQALWTASRVAAAILGALLITLIGALFLIGRRRVSL